MATRTLCILGVLAMAIPCMAQDLDILPALEGAPPPGRMLTDYLLGKAGEAFQRRAEAYEAIKTPEDIAAYQKRMRDFFVQQLGGFPEPTPLNARVVEKLDRDAFRIEKLIYESRPDFFVTAALFLPVTEGPYPGVLVPCGHSANGKASEAYQRACMLLAQNGIAALIYDPIGQGERVQLLKDDGSPRHGSTFEHCLVGVGCTLLGTNTATYRVYDGMRGIDYLCSRPDIDPQRIGCTGNSGGGTLTSYIMALDERVVCAAPSCYLTSFACLFEEAGPQDAEQNIAGQIAYGMDHAEYVLMRAPKPTLMCCASGDFFDIRGSWDAFREAKRVYTRLGFPERVDLVEAPEKHGFSLLLRQGMARWMRRWLLHVDDAVVEQQDLPILTDEEMQCSPKGQVNLMDGARTAFDINCDLAGQLAEARKAFWAGAPRDEALQAVRDTARIRPLGDIPQPEVTPLDAIDRDGYRIKRLALKPEPGIVLPALLFVPAAPNGEACLYVHGDGKTAAAQPGGPIDERVRAGQLVLAPDLRGMGETISEWGARGWGDTLGLDWKEAVLATMLDKPYLAMRAEDIMVCARFLAGYGAPEPTRPVHLVAVGASGPAAIHAAALQSDLFVSLRLERVLQSWDAVVRTPEAVRQLENTVHGALRRYDLTDLLASLPPDSVTVLDPADAMGSPVSTNLR
jgi:dienelactone hydrolase